MRVVASWSTVTSPLVAERPICGIEFLLLVGERPAGGGRSLQGRLGLGGAGRRLHARRGVLDGPVGDGLGRCVTVNHGVALVSRRRLTAFQVNVESTGRSE